MKKKNLILLIIINVLLTVSKFLIIVDYTYRAFIKSNKDYVTFFIGIAIAVALDLIVNYMAVKIANKKEETDRFKYHKVIIIPCVITLIFMTLGLI